MKSEYYVQGSAATPYLLSLERTMDRLTISCSCKAGVNNTLCKHRLALLSGNFVGASAAPGSTLDGIRDLVNGSDIESLYQEFLVIDRELGELKARHGKTKKLLARTMRGS